jgi:hypothetical protein
MASGTQRGQVADQFITKPLVGAMMDLEFDLSCHAVAYAASVTCRLKFCQPGGTKPPAAAVDIFIVRHHELHIRDKFPRVIVHVLCKINKVISRQVAFFTQEKIWYG